MATIKAGDFSRKSINRFSPMCRKGVNVPGDELSFEGLTFSIQKYLVETPGTIEQKFTDHTSHERLKYRV